MFLRACRASVGKGAACSRTATSGSPVSGSSRSAASAPPQVRRPSLPFRLNRPGVQKVKLMRDWCVCLYVVCAVEVKEGLINAIAVGDYRSFVLRRPLVDYGDAVIMPGLIDV